jgi:predicted nuclease with RNAse H fold
MVKLYVVSSLEGGKTKEGVGGEGFLAPSQSMIIMHDPKTTTILGIDLAGVPTRPTGICILKNMTVETSLAYTDEEIVGIAESCQPAVITIDAPLTLPPGRKTIEDRNGEHLRPCDRELLRRKIKFFPITLGPMRTLTRRGIVLKERLQPLSCPILEVYPGGSQDILGIPRKQQGLDKMKKGHEELGIQGLKKSMSDHELDAVTAAYVGKLFLEEKAEVYGNHEEDGIVMPIASKRST